jgi:hypothetical protein
MSFNRVLLFGSIVQLFEAGILNRMTSLEYVRLENQIMEGINARATTVDEAKEQNESLLQAKPLTMKMLQGAFIVLGIGYIFGSG